MDAARVDVSEVATPEAGSADVAPDVAVSESGADVTIDVADASTVIFHDDFNGASLSRWTQASGSWSLSAGEARVPSGSFEMFATGFEAQTNYRVSTQMRIAGAGVPGGALEIAFRIESTSLDEWHCNWEPVPQANLVYLKLQQFGQWPVIVTAVDVTTLTNYSALSKFTMDVVVVGGSADCSIREIPAARAALTGGILRANGTFGLRTFNLPAAFDEFTVTSAP